MLNRHTIEATLRALLMQFQSPSDMDPGRITRFAHAGAEALLMQTRLDPWLDSATSAEILQMTVPELHEQVRSGVLPAARGPGGELRLHRRDVSLYWLSQHLDATASLVPFGDWRGETDVWDFDPWIEATPG